MNLAGPVLNLFPTDSSAPFHLAIVGEAPGDYEVQWHQPFVGPSGKVLNSLLERIGLSRSQCFIGNVFQYQPPGNDIEKIDQNSPEWRVCTEQLLADLRRFQPTVTLCLGNLAMKFLCDRSKITQWRGSILFSTHAGIGKCIPTIHPAAVLRQWPWYNTVLLDFEKAKDEMLHQGRPLPQRTYMICHTYFSVFDELRKLQDAEEFAFDIESIRGTNELTCIGFAPREDYGVVVPLGVWTPAEEAMILPAVERLLAGPARKIVQNGAFDLGMLLTQHGIVVENLVMDTMLAQHACYPELRKSLAFLCSMYTREPYYKWEAKRTAAEGEGEDDEAAWGAHVTRDQLYTYNAKDCCVTLECAHALQKELADLGAERAFQISMSLLPLAIEMTARGILIDKGQAAKRLIELNQEIAAATDTAKRMFGKDVNTKSPKQMKQLLYADLGLPEQTVRTGKRGSVKRVTTNEDALLELARQSQGRSFDLMVLLKQRQLRTKTSFFKVDTYKDGRIHAGFKVGGTETRRWSSSESFLGGRNIMNIPDDCRDIYVADPGKVFVGFDLSAAEARVVAYKSFICTGSSTYKTVIDGKMKIHTWFAMRLIDEGICPQTKEYFLEHATNENEWYYLSKVSVHGFSYDLGELKWCRKVASESDGKILVQVSVAKRIKATLYQSLDSIPLWQKAIQAYLSRNRTMYSAFGGVRTFFERWGDDLFGEAYAHEPQTTVADCIGEAMIRIAKALPHFEFLHYNYDSVFGQVPESDADATIAAMKPLVEVPFKIWNFERTKWVELTIPASFKKGRTWAELK